MDIIVDIDGTLANIEHRLHFIRKPSLRVIEGTDNVKRGDYEAWKAWNPNWPAFERACIHDAPIPEVIELVNSLGVYDSNGNQTNRLIFATGRHEWTRGGTMGWLYSNVDVYRLAEYPLYMRADGDHRPDHVVKREMLYKMRTDGYDPKLAIDDRQQVVDMWRAEGLICAQVAKGDF